MSRDRDDVATDAELEQELNAPDAPPAHKAAWTLYTKAEQESREIEASNERRDWFFQNYERTEATS